MFAQQQKQSEEEEEERRVNLFLCCFSFPLIACARLVGWFSAVPLMFAMLLLPFASTSMLDMAPEIILLGSEMLCVLALFFGVQHQQPNYLRPFLFFGLIWNLALLLLLLFTV
uniref:Protein YIPF n=1 Tax=Globodera pallida TaxID=36090 RepID=A0A183CPE2_GLOPA